MNNTQPQDFPRRILLTLAGHSPAIITETLYALTQQQPAYIPTAIIVITTSSGKAILLQKLLGKARVLKRFCADYNVELPTLNESSIHVITDKANNTLNDLQTEIDNEIAADFITTKVRELTQDSDCSLHVSIAGGRKTMTYYLGYAMSVFGRIQDRMSHVLVDDNYAVPEFYYPTKTSQTLISRMQTPFDARDVKVMLGDLPFIRLRDGLTADLLNNEAVSYSELINIAQRQLAPTKVELRHTPERKNKPWQLFCSGSEITGLDNAELAVYVWLLQRHKTKKAEGLNFDRRPNNEKRAKEFLEIYKKLFNEYSGGYSKVHRALIEDGERKKEGITSKYFSPKKTNINQNLEKSLSVLGAKKYHIIDLIEDGITYISLPLTLLPEDIFLPAHLDAVDTTRSQV